MNTVEIMVLVWVCALGWFWLDSIKVREVAVQVARECCRSEAVQLLDDTVAIRSLSLGRNDRGHVVLRRSYDFEYSTSGDNRHRGSVMLLGREVMLLDVSQHRSPSA